MQGHLKYTQGNTQNTPLNVDLFEISFDFMINIDDEVAFMLNV